MDDREVVAARHRCTRVALSGRQQHRRERVAERMTAHPHEARLPAGVLHHAPNTFSAVSHAGRHIRRVAVGAQGGLSPCGCRCHRPGGWISARRAPASQSESTAAWRITGKGSPSYALAARSQNSTRCRAAPFSVRLRGCGELHTQASVHTIPNVARPRLHQPSAS